MVEKKDSFLFIGALGVVYGDIGTSPLYALKSCFALGGLEVTPLNILGIISLFVWILLSVVTLKYIHFVMTFDNNGEGGILALSTLITKTKASRYWGFPTILGIVGASLFFGDAIITPAISVLGAIEGVSLLNPFLSPFIPFLALIILTILFALQRFGSGKLGNYFGVIMVSWFAVIAAIGIMGIMKSPQILLALNPYYAIHFFYHNGMTSFLVLGGAILVVTGAEALYADLGHFGRRIIHLSWTYCVFPSLLLNYLGQGGLLLSDFSSIQNPFYLLISEEYIFLLIGLATCATIIASQAVISGIFSVCWQGIMLNLLPRMRVIHTSFHKIGQVYIPAINIIIYVLTAMVVWHFQSSESIAAAYGVSVSGEMFITTLLLFLLTSQNLEWNWGKLILVFTPLFILDFGFVSMNMIKFLEGGWFPFLVACIIFYIMWVWYQGNLALLQQKNNYSASLRNYVLNYEQIIPQKIPGTAVFLTRTDKHPPNSLIIHLKHNKFLHENIFFVTIEVTNTPKVPKNQRFSIDIVNEHFYVIVAKFGFKEVADLTKIIAWAREEHYLTETNDISIYLAKGHAIPTKGARLKGISEKIYVFLSRNAISSHEFYKIPDQMVVEYNARYKI